MKWPGVPTGDPDYDVITAESQGRIFKHQQMLVQVQRPGGTPVTSRDRTRTQRPERPPPVAILLFLKASLCAQMSSGRKKKGEGRGKKS